jgi:copper resistance protein B
MRIRERRRHGVYALLSAATLLATSAARPEEASAPFEIAAHGMLEDPFNRSLLLDELETRDGGDLAWDATFWAGRAFDRLAVRTAGEKHGGDTRRAELELLWSHAAARWWDLVAGVRADFAPGPTQRAVAFGVQGLAPYRFELEATAYLAEGGEAAAHFASEYDVLITRRLILEPKLELEWYGTTDVARRRGAGLANVEVALRLRYEIRREVAPYVGLERERKHGRTAALARAAGEDDDDTRLVAGVRIWF